MLLPHDDSPFHLSPPQQLRLTCERLLCGLKDLHAYWPQASVCDRAEEVRALLAEVAEYEAADR